MKSDLVNALCEEGDVPTERTLTPEEAKTYDYDVGGLSEFPIKRLSVDGAQLDFEEGDKAVWILNVVVAPRQRRQGKATALMQALYAKGKRVNHGTLTDLGRKLHSSPTIRALVGRSTGARPCW